MALHTTKHLIQCFSPGGWKVGPLEKIWQLEDIFGRAHVGFGVEGRAQGR